MPLIEWNARLSVEIEEIDQQHKQLVKLINDLDDAMHEGKGKVVIGRIISSLLQYARSHFATEEKYFSQFGYPDAPAHVQEHVSFISKAMAFKKDFDEARMGLTISVMDFLSDWLQDHIKGVDQKYGAFFREKGLK